MQDNACLKNLVTKRNLEIEVMKEISAKAYDAIYSE